MGTLYILKEHLCQESRGAENRSKVIVENFLKDDWMTGQLVSYHLYHTSFH